MTLIEVALASTLTAVLMGAILMVTENVSGSYETSLSVSILESKGRRSLLQIEEIVRGSTAQDIEPSPAPPESTSRVDVQRIVRFEDPDPVWSDTERVILEFMPGEIDDGVDNDGDGLVDECRAVLIERPGAPDQSRRVICTNVAEFQPGETLDLADNNGNGLEDERGLSFDVTDERIRILLTLEAMDPSGIRISRTFTRTVAFRARR